MKSERGVKNLNLGKAVLNEGLKQSPLYVDCVFAFFFGVVFTKHY